MAYLTLNGISFSADYGSGPGYSQQEIGPGLSTAYDGTAFRGNLGFKNRFKLTSALDTQANTQALRSLLRGDVDHVGWASDDYSDKGAAATYLNGGTHSLGSGGKWAGYGKASLPNTSATVQWPFALGSNWTVMFWSQLNGAGYHHYIQRSDNVNWTDGVQGSGSLGLSTVSSGLLVLNYGSGTNRDYSDLVVFNFVIPTSWGPSLYTFSNTQEWTLAPKLLTGGDIGAYTVMGQPGDSKIVQASLSAGSFTDNNEMMAFELWEG